MSRSALIYSAGVSMGVAGLSAGIAIGYFGRKAIYANFRQRKVYIGMIVCLIFCEAIALYGIINTVGIILALKK